ncbi:hypothetical protein L6452_37374 [Arctium lappa]|uniref:Uncharacterized protein n=1 Tax=Arctium lappa TaxID=4217 RepID=A0ACB8Y217_ARCLA|nr:hypothetical protein L6452_37374 [Arctium lappa]
MDFPQEVPSAFSSGMMVISFGNILKLMFQEKCTLQELERIAKALEEPKEELRRLILDPAMGSNTKLSLIYSVHRLGLTYLFLQEIEGQLDKLFNELNLQDDDEADLYTISVYFQVFRHLGYKLSCGK